MPKSRKSKAKYQDFQKVKLKVGKKLPKADNVTNTSFQSRSINLKEQLKQPDSSRQPTNKKKQNISDLLSHCQHYNISVRHAAITGLRELVTSNVDVLHTNLSLILESVSGLCLDRDSAVRHALSRFLKTALPQISDTQIAPFFSILSAHLCCAMTHIDDEIQIDSLQLMDLCIENYPRLVVASSNNLLQHFIDQISKQSNSATKNTQGGNLNNPGRSLLVNPNSKLSSSKWRVQVLNRLHRFLTAVLDQSEPNKKRMDVEDRESLNIDINETSWHQPTSSDHLRPCTTYSMSGLRKSEDASGVDMLVNGEKLKSVVDALIPLLLQCWVEFGPGQFSSDSSGNSMSPEALSSLASILNVIRLLQKCVERYDKNADSVMIQDLRRKYTNDFVQYLMPFFPYSMHRRPSTGKKKLPKANSLNVPVMTVNLMVCEVMSHLVESNDGLQPEWTSQLTAYITHCTKATLSSDQIQIILSFINKMFQYTDQDTKEELMEATCYLFGAKHRLSKDRILLMEFISHQILEDRSHKFLRMEGVRKWLSLLPGLLTHSCGESDEISIATLITMRKIGPIGDEHFLEALQNNCVPLIECLSKMKLALQAYLMDVLFWVPAWRKRELGALAKVSHEQILQPRHLHRLLICILHKKNTYCDTDTDETVFEVGDLFGFLLSVAAGRKLDDIDSLVNGQQNSDQYKCIIPAESIRTWSKSIEYTKVVCDILQQFTNTHQVSSLVSSALHSILSERPRLPLDTVTSFIQVVTAIHHANGGIIPSQPSTVVSSAVSIATDAVALAVTNLEENQQQAEVGVVRESVLAVCQNLLASSPDTVIGFTNYLLGRMSECREVETVYRYVIVLGMINQDNRLRSQMAGHWNHTSSVISKLKDAIPDLEKHAWWSDLKYKHSLLQPRRS